MSLTLSRIFMEAFVRLGITARGALGGVETKLSELVRSGHLSQLPLLQA